MRTLLLLLVSLLALPALAADVCSAAPLQDELQWLRRLSLDLSGRVPTKAELDQLLATGKVEAPQLDGLLQKPQVKRLVRAWLREAIYANLYLPLTQEFQLVRTDGTGGLAASGDVLWLPNRGLSYRPKVNGDSMPCLDEPMQLDPDGNISTRDSGDGYPREGWVEVHPYWETDPAAKVKVCAFDAQTALRSPDGADCARHENARNSACGCGPALEFCQGSTLGQPDTSVVINRALVEQAMRLGDRVVDEGRPLSDVLILRELEVNGPIAHYLNKQVATTVEFASRPNPTFVPPQLQFTDPQWKRVALTGRASGVLATPHYLLKFPTNRSRANRFFNAFLCRALQAPADGLPSPTDPCSREPDLSRRCGCSTCHYALEPAAAHWGRFTEAGTWELTDTEFPSFDPACVANGTTPLPARCAFYLTQARTSAEQPYVGKLRALLFASPQAEAAMAGGPGAWARAEIDSKAFGACVTSRFFEALVGRPLRDDLADERKLKADLLQRYQEGGQLGALLRSIVTLPQYRRARAAHEPVPGGQP